MTKSMNQRQYWNRQIRRQVRLVCHMAQKCLRNAPGNCADLRVVEDDSTSDNDSDNDVNAVANAAGAEGGDNE